MKCVVIVLAIALLFVQAANADVESECISGETRQIECNNCFCTDGYWACTRMECHPKPFTVKERRSLTTPCQDGDTQLDDEKCNTCTCHQGHWACTEKLCQPAS